MDNASPTIVVVFGQKNSSQSIMQLQIYWRNRALLAWGGGGWKWNARNVAKSERKILDFKTQKNNISPTIVVIFGQKKSFQYITQLQIYWRNGALLA